LLEDVQLTRTLRKLASSTGSIDDLQQ